VALEASREPTEASAQLPDRIGIDLGGTKIATLKLSATGKVLYQQRQATPQASYQGILDALSKTITAAQQAAGSSQTTTIGIGTPGARSSKTGLMKNSNTTVINGQDLLGDLEKICQQPIRMANDADCFTLSEAVDGAGAGADLVFGVILGTGVGGGICLQQRITNGPNAIVGEWGHNLMPLDRLPQELASALVRGRACYCGKTDCIETWLSGPGVSRTYREITGQSATALEIFSGSVPNTYRQMVTDLYCELAALGLSTVINVIDPDCIILGGGLSNIEGLNQEIVSRLSPYVFSDHINTVVAKAKHGDASGVRGAAWLW